MAYAIAPALGFEIHWPHWCGECGAGIPSSVDAMLNRGIPHSGKSGPLGKSSSFAEVCQKVISLRVICLSGFGSPSAISGEVTSRSIDTIKCVILRTISHIGKEFRKIVNPRRIYGNVSVVFRSRTPVLHASPRPISQWMVTAKSSRALHNPFISQASTAPRQAVPQSERVNWLDSAAFASTFPVDMGGVIRVLNLSQNGPTVKRLTGQVNDRRHIWLIA